jgi:hypothetical protein
MQIKHIETLVSAGEFACSNEWAELRAQLHAAVRRVDWPSGSGSLTIHPGSARDRGLANGLAPIKTALMEQLRGAAWLLEERLDIAQTTQPEKIDAVFRMVQGDFAVEWETGDISSSHRAMNKLGLAMLKRILVGGTLIVPTSNFYQYLSDRVGNWDELAPYLDLWKSIPIQNGVWEVVVVEHDATSTGVPRIG